MLRSPGAFSSSSSSSSASRGAYGGTRGAIPGARGNAPFFGYGRKHVINRLFTVHAILMLVVGLLSVIFPEVLVYLLHHSAEGFHARHEGGDVRIAFVIMRVLGGFLLAQSYLLHVVKSADGVIRRAFVQSYFAAFLLTTLALGRAQLTETNPVRWSNWLVILLFATLTGSYAWFAFFERIAVYELGR